MKKKTIVSILAVLLALALFAGCGGTGGSTNTPAPAGTAAPAKTAAPAATAAPAGTAAPANTAAPAETKPAKDKVLRIAITSVMTGLDVTHGQGSTQMLEQANMLETLTVLDKDFTVLPCLATSWERTGEKTWVFHLREGVLFHDGTPLNASAVKWCLDEKSKYVDTYASYTHIESIDLIDDMTLQFNTSDPTSELANVLASQIGTIMAPSSFKADGTFDRPIGTGCFKYEDFDVSASILTAAYFDQYWGGDPGSSVGKRVIISIPDASTRSLAAINGEVDIMMDAPFAELANLEQDSNLSVSKYTTTRTYYLEQNIRKEYLQDVRVRRALLYAVDRETILNELLMGVGGVPQGILDPSMPWANTDVDPYAYDPAKAMALLDEAGIKDNDGNGWREYNGKDLELVLLTMNFRPGCPLILQAMQQYYEDIGLKCVTKIVENSTVTQIRNDNEYDLNLSSASATYVPTASYYLSSLYWSESSNPKLIGYKNEKLDELYLQCLAEDDLQKKYELAKEAQALAQEDAVFTTMMLYGAVFINSAKVTGFDYSPAVHDFIVPKSTDLRD